MAAPVFLSVYTGSHLYKVGRVGFDSGNADSGGNYIATFRTEKIAPMNYDGVMLFRRLLLRIYRTGPFVLTLTAYVDGTQTQAYNSGVLQNQSVVFNFPSSAVSPDKTLLEMALSARGTYIEVQGVIVSNTVSGIFLPEEIEVDYDPLRTTRQGAVAQTS